LLTKAPHSFAINIMQVLSLLWVWPFVTAKYPHIIRYAVAVLVGILVIDVLNVSVAHTYEGYVFTPLLFSFFVIFGVNTLGIGDYLIGYLCTTLISHRQLAHHPFVVALFTIVAGLPLVLLTMLLPGGFALPYSIFIILPYLAVAAATHTSEIHGHRKMWFEKTEKR